MKIKVSKKIIPGIFLLMIQALVFCRDGICAETVISPQMAVKIYFDAYVAQDWEVVTEYMHPDLLQSLKSRIIAMIREVSADTRELLLRAYKARSVDDLEWMPARPLYILYLKYRWEGMDAHAVSALQSTEFEFMEAVKISAEECLVKFKTSVTIENHTYNKIQVYHMKKFDEKWKIYDTEGLKELDTDMPSDIEVL